MNILKRKIHKSLFPNNKCSSKFTTMEHFEMFYNTKCDFKSNKVLNNLQKHMRRIRKINVKIKNNNEFCIGRINTNKFPQV